MNTTPPMHLISATPPVFPAWLWSTVAADWIYVATDILTTIDCRASGYTHWSPDSPTAPLGEPGKPDRLRMDYINSLPQPFIAHFFGGAEWPVHDIEVRTGLLRIDVCGKLDIKSIGEVKYFRDMNGVEHDTDTFYTDYVPTAAASLPSPQGENKTLREQIAGWSQVLCYQGDLKILAHNLREAQKYMEAGCPKGRYTWLDAPIDLADEYANKHAPASPAPQGLREVLHQALGEISGLTMSQFVSPTDAWNARVEHLLTAITPFLSHAGGGAEDPNERDMEVFLEAHRVFHSSQNQHTQFEHSAAAVIGQYRKELLSAPPQPDATGMDWRTIARKLWMLLDDIDTQDDASKGNDAHFRKSAYQIQQKRHDIISGDKL